MNTFVSLLMWGTAMLGMRWFLGLGLDEKEIERERKGGMNGEYFMYPYLRPIGITCMVVGATGVAVVSVMSWTH